MSDDEIANQIAKQCALAVCFALMARSTSGSKRTHLISIANQFTVHSIRLIATHKDACERWMKARQASEARLR